MLEKSTAVLPEDRRAHGRLGYQSKENKRRDVTERQAERAKRTPQEQIAILDRRLGIGQGAVRERAKLVALINK